jgi:hypothetical protein
MNNLIGDPTENNLERGPEFKDNEMDTDVEGVKADSFVQIGTIKIPKFNVSQEDFYQNFQDGRRRLRWKTDTPVQKYMSGTKYRNPFYVSYTDEAGRTYTRKVK